ncbi:MAG: hypothetical protein AAF561_09275 [Planctomycetota bacterium]
MKKQLTFAVLAAATASIAATTASAAVLYEANFEAPTFTSGASVFGQDGWGATDNTWDIITVDGNQVVSYEQGDTINNTPQANGRIDRGITAQTGDLYFAVDVTFDNFNFVWFNLSDDEDDNNSIGFTSTSGSGGGIRARARDSGNTNGPDVSLDLGTTYTVVIKASKSDPLGNYDTAELFLDPGATEPVIADSIAVSDIGISEIDFFRIRRGGGVGTDDPDVTFDKFRIATTYAEVIPEPASATALSVLGLLALRRRR